MRYSSCFVLLIIGIVFQMTGCGQEKNLVRISINYPKAAGDTVIVGRVNMINLDAIELGRVVLDSLGKGVVQAVVEEPIFAHIKGGHIAAGMLISPGDDLTIVPSAKGSKLTLQFEGDGGAVNQILNEGSQVRKSFEKWNGVFAFNLEPNEFIKAKDSLQRSYDQLLAKLKSDKQVSAEAQNFLKRAMDMHVLFYQYNFTGGKDSTEIPLSVRKLTETLPIDTIALRMGVFDYSMIASTFYWHRIGNAIYEENNEMEGDSLESIFPLLVEKKIKAAKYPKPVEDFLRAKSADIQIGLNGLTPNLRRVANTLTNEIASEDYLSVIRKNVARWEKIGRGKPAPDFAGMAPDGKKLALSDLRGKIVYVDIWATWCGPCIGEFPDSKKVQADFKGNDKVAFLYVSIDRDTLAWKKMVSGNKVPSGIHILNGVDSPNSVWSQYYVWGVPRYLMIDATGRMVATHAVRPSSGKVTAELQKLLNSNKLVQN